MTCHVQNYDIHFSLCHSDKLPSGIPACVPPSNEKIDLKRLKGDIPKFYNSRCFEDEHVKWWTEFLSHKEGIFKIPEKAATWPLDDILLTKQRQRDQAPAEDQHETASVLEIPRLVNAPPEIEKLVADQVEEIPEVTKTEIASAPMKLIFQQINKNRTHLHLIWSDLVKKPGSSLSSDF